MNEKELIRKLWGEMIRTKCQYCKHFERGGFSSVESCNLFIGLSAKLLEEQECPDYEWETRLTKEDFL